MLRFHPVHGEDVFFISRPAADPDNYQAGKTHQARNIPSMGE